ncbi:MAG: FCD domain-containing protein [Limisphaerales bacterium]
MAPGENRVPEAGLVRVPERRQRQSSGYRRKRVRPSARFGGRFPFQKPNQQFHRTIVEAAGNSILLKTWDAPFLRMRKRFTMDCVQSADPVDPVAIAREHLAIVDALNRGHSELAAALLASHSNPLVDFLRSELLLHHDALHSHSKEPPDEPAFPLASRLGHRHRAICGDAGSSGRQTESNGPRARHPRGNDH